MVLLISWEGNSDCYILVVCILVTCSTFADFTGGSSIPGLLLPPKDRAFEAICRGIGCLGAEGAPSDRTMRKLNHHGSFMSSTLCRAWLGEC